jgi:2-aminoadipate transaminase
MFPRPQLDPSSRIPLYKQLHAQFRNWIDGGRLPHGEKLPSTRELAGLLGLNRTTVAAAYSLLESEGLIRGHVGRGSFVIGEPRLEPLGLDWDRLLDGPDRLSMAPVQHQAATDAVISFSTARPAEQLFPLEEVRATCREVLGSPQAATILQLGSPGGYPPFREYLLAEARRAGIARSEDDVLITNGCQQGLDLVQRVLVRPGDVVLVEDPVYPGVRNLFARAGARVAGVPVGLQGLDVEHLGRALGREKPRLLVLTPSFQNPTGTTIPLASRRLILAQAREAGVVVVENDICGDLRYEGEPLPPLKQLDESGDTILLRSFSKVAFPGLRVGWATGPRALVARLADAKQLTDLHTDQLSQAVLLRFAESGRLAAHRARILVAGAERLAAVLESCERWLPAGTRFTRPQGGMNLWVRLPEPLDAAELLPRAERENVTYVPGRYFEVTRHEPGSLRLSFAALAPDKIRAGLAILGEVFSSELERARAARRYDPAPAMV